MSAFVDNDSCTQVFVCMSKAFEFVDRLELSMFSRFVNDGSSVRLFVSASKLFESVKCSLLLEAQLLPS